MQMFEGSYFGCLAEEKKISQWPEIEIRLNMTGQKSDRRKTCSIILKHKHNRKEKLWERVAEWRKHRCIQRAEGQETFKKNTSSISVFLLL